MKQLGKLGIEWEKAKRDVLRPLFEKEGITYCEFKGTMCWGEGTTFAHVLRRRHLGKWDSEEREYNLMNVCRLCIPCHDYLDTVLGEERGGEVIQGIINRRKNIFLLEDL